MKTSWMWLRYLGPLSVGIVVPVAKSGNLSVLAGLIITTITLTVSGICYYEMGLRKIDL